MSMVAAAPAEPDFVPASMAELAEHYYDYILRQVRKYGIPAQDAADTAAWIIERLSVTGALAQYDPGYLTEHQGRHVRTRFSTFLTAKIELYCRGERSRLGRRTAHELLLMDIPAEDGGLGDVLGAAWDDYSALDAEAFTDWVCSRLAEVPRRSPRDTCDLPALFREVARQVSDTGQDKVSYELIRERFGVSGTTAGAWLSRLRQVLKPILGRPLASIGGVSLDLEQVAAAVKILRESPGIMVHQPLLAAGHPLGLAARDVPGRERWYHQFAAEEIAKFPGLRTGAGSHGKPAGHVKEAVIHRLEGILAEAGSRPPLLVPGEPDAEPEPVTAEEELEAALWHLTSSAAEVDRIRELAQRAYAVPS